MQTYSQAEKELSNKDFSDMRNQKLCESVSIITVPKFNAHPETPSIIRMCEGCIVRQG